MTRREELEVELKLQATTDPLTGLFNRRQYEMLFRREQERVRRHGCELSLCVVDLDHFKQINDQYGHDLGDQVLRQVAKLFVDTLRHSDIVGRFGGEEFILLLPDTALESALLVIGRLREKLQEEVVESEGEQVSLTATFAVTQVTNEDVTIEDVIRRADKALYQGKAAGRNRVMAT
ncbi:MAG: GGDEF domain-containing protein [Pseudomonas sp.]